MIYRFTPTLALPPQGEGIYYCISMSFPSPLAEEGKVSRIISFFSHLPLSKWKGSEIEFQISLARFSADNNSIPDCGGQVKRAGGHSGRAGKNSICRQFRMSRLVFAGKIYPKYQRKKGAPDKASFCLFIINWGRFMNRPYIPAWGATTQGRPHIS